jgi:predicted lipid carrier protein YhbT
MPIKWSADEVSKVMEEVERQINLADAFLAEAKTKAEAARKIANLPQYVDQRLLHLIGDIERINSVRNAIDAVRKSIPDGAIEVEREHLKNGSQQSLIN